jgi:hypothetical protein
MNITFYEEGSPWQLNGQFWQAPCTLITQGVHAGSHGPIFWADHVLKEAVSSWSYIPVTLGHPMVGDSHVSVNHSPETFVKYSLGEVINPYFDEAKKAIRGTLQIPVGLPKALMDRVKNLREVSVGIFSEDTQTYGQYNGKDYHACAISMKPDHLAILPEDQRGACSWEDSCGVRVNSMQHLQGDYEMTTEKLLPVDVYRKDETITEDELRTLQYEADEHELLLPGCFNVNLDRVKPKSDDTYQDDGMLLPAGVE